MEMQVSTAQNNIILQSDVTWLYYVEIACTLIKVEN